MKNRNWTLVDPMYMYTSNLSISGLALISNEKYQLNSVIRVEIKSEDGSITNLIGKVVRCLDSGSSIYTVGIEFLKLLDETQVKDLYNQFQ